MAKKAPHPLCTIYTQKTRHDQADSVVCVNFSNMPQGKMYELSVRLLGLATPTEDWSAFRRPLLERVYAVVGVARCQSTLVSPTTPYTVAIGVRDHAVDNVKADLHAYLSQFNVHVGVFP